MAQGVEAVPSLLQGAKSDVLVIGDPKHAKQDVVEASISYFYYSSVSSIGHSVSHN